ncbi:glycosyltransferase family 2 protein [Patescibacteria group bacterium]|nr:glycosyltransferase family 2 protein [Patescibacteria group bacterium]MBU2263672.1 glycosyltransferase family 2 protein [Patescibacteria group bacterium]
MQIMETYLSVIIPAYNEENRIPKTLRAISSYLQKQPYSYEILVVCDGPKDKTADVVRDLKLSVPNLDLIDRKKNMGKGYTVKEGMFASKGKIRLFTDADNSTDISYFEKMRPLFDKGYDIVISTRDPKDAEGAGQDVPQPWYKRLMGNMGNLYIQLLAVPGIWDTQNGFKAFRDYAAEKIFPLTRINRWAFDVESLALARKFKYKIGIIPIHWINDPKSHVSLMAYFKVLFDVLKIRWNITRGKYNEQDGK